MSGQLSEERTVYSTNSVGKNGIFTCQRMNLDPYLTPYTNINSDQRCRYLRLKIMQFLEENIWENLHDFGLGNDFLDMTPNNIAKKKKR